MPPMNKEGGGSGRRKSMNPFSSRGTLTNLTQLNTNIANTDGEDKKDKKSLIKRNSMFGIGSGSSPNLMSGDSSKSPVPTERSSSPKLRPKTLQKGRPNSVFGSIGRKSMNSFRGDGEGSGNLMSTTPDSPTDAAGPSIAPGGILNGRNVLHHGEVQTQSGMFRKKKEYLVLTDSHLIRFKSQSRAAEAFSSIPPMNGRSSSTRHPSTASIGSLHEVQSSNSHASAEGENKIPLGQIVTAYKVEDGRPFFTTEVVYLDEEYYGVGSIQLMLHDPKEADLWHTSIRAAAQKARLLMDEPYPERVVRYLVQALEAVDDYDSNRFQVFRVVKRAATPKGGKASSDDLQKLNSSVFYMVVGINRIHLVPLPDFSEPSGRKLNSKASRNVYGMVTLVAINLSTTDDKFELTFRLPMQAPTQVDLAASAPSDIAVVIFRCVQYLKPQWLDYNFLYAGPRRLLESVDAPILMDEEDYGCFDRTLVAYCMAYGCNPVNVRYLVDDTAEDGLQFKLYPPAITKKYSLHELLSIFRALRYTECFTSISFSGIDLHSMHTLIDTHGTDHVAWENRVRKPVQEFFGMKPGERSILYQEIQAIALKSNRLRKIDFSDCLPRRRPKDNFELEGEGGASADVEKDPGCEIVAALLSLCRGGFTNIDWIVLSGIELGETDLDDLIPAIHSLQSGLRAMECARCGLNDRGIMQIVGHLERQNRTLECIDISDNPGRIDVGRFQVAMSVFSRLRKLDLSRVAKSSGDAPLFKAEVMLSWRLEELIMNGVQINEQTLDSICEYLASPQSDGLRTLQMDQTNLTGTHVALLMRSMSRAPGVARDLQLTVSANRLENGIRDIVQAVERNEGPAHLSMRMIEFSKEDHFKHLVEALRTNTTIRSLDLGKASLPYDAGPETCDALRLLFADNTTLEELDISGEQAHLEVTRFGIGLNHALTGLKGNKTLKVLRIEFQNLGLEGANTLSSVLEENTGLTHIYCEHNDLNLQAFTILVNALAHNHTLLELPHMRNDQDESMRRMSKNMRDSRKTMQTPRHPHTNQAKSTVRKTLGISKPSPAQAEITSQDLDDVVRVLAEKWQHEVHRLSVFLERNRNMAAGIQDGHLPQAEGFSHEDLRPTTAMSDRGILEQVLSNTTPRFELGNPVDDHISNKTSGLGISGGSERGSDGKRSEDLEATPRAIRTKNYLGSLDHERNGFANGIADSYGGFRMGGDDTPARKEREVEDGTASPGGDVFEMEGHS